MSELSAEKVEPLLTGRFGRPYVYEERCTSTQALLDPSAPEGAVAVADEQTAGRGRLGSSWEAPPGTSILCSVLLRPPPGPGLPQLSLVGGLAAAVVIEEELELWRSSQIKWPNDVMINRRKVAGVLAEARDGIVVLGTGINVNQTRDELPQDARQPVASLRTIDGRVHDRAALLADLLARLERFYTAWLEGGLEALFGDLGSRDFLRGRRITVDGVEGVAEGIDREGRLLVAGRALDSGEVSYER